MTVAAALVLYVVTVLSIGPRLLARITAHGEAPRLAIAAWLTAVVTVLGCAVAAIGLLLVEAAGHWDSPDRLIASCVERLHAILQGHAGLPAQIIATAAVVIAIGSLIAICARIGQALRRMRSNTLAHADAVRLVGTSHGGDVIVIKASEAAAYCVAGRPAAIVVTTAALTALDEAQLAAVIAHERAHLDGRHTYCVAALRGVTSALPWIRLFTIAATHIGSLLEMCADDAAARRHGRQPLLGGLLALSGADTPAHGLAASAIAVLVRAERLADPPHGIARIQTLLTLSGAVAAMAATPLAIVALALSGALICFA